MVLMHRSARETQLRKMKGKTMPSVAELIAALPEPSTRPRTDLPAPLNPLLEAWSHRPVPVGRFRRLRMLGTLQAQIAAAYAFYWLRGWFKGADESKRLLAETHWRTAMRILDSMSYLRGAAMKVGQTLANFPDIAPREFVETFEKLHYTAPPMHWSLLKEMVFNELGEDPENLFARSTSGHSRPLRWARYMRRGSKPAKRSPSKFNTRVLPAPFERTFAT